MSRNETFCRECSVEDTVFPDDTSVCCNVCAEEEKNKLKLKDWIAQGKQCPGPGVPGIPGCLFNISKSAKLMMDKQMGLGFIIWSSVFDYYHTDPNTEELNMNRLYDMERRDVEQKKGQLLCANCRQIKASHEYQVLLRRKWDEADLSDDENTDDEPDYPDH